MIIILLTYTSVMFYPQLTASFSMSVDVVNWVCVTKKTDIDTQKHY